MALAAQRACNHPGCRALIRGAAYCEKHRREQRDRHEKNSYQRGYDKTWAKVRKAKLMETPLCEDCLASGRTTMATEAHHLEKIKDRPDLRLDIGNLMSLCKPCHAARTQRGE